MGAETVPDFLNSYLDYPLEHWEAGLYLSEVMTMVPTFQAPAPLWVKASSLQCAIANFKSA